MLSDIAMVAADTTRSRAYFQALLRHRLLPACVVLLGVLPGRQLPGQLAQVVEEARPPAAGDGDWSEAGFNVHEPFAHSIAKAGVPVCQLTTHDINSDEARQALSDRPEKTFIFSGYGGVLVGEKTLATGKNFLHVHGGYLPDFKGSTTNYYSLLAKREMGASALFLTKDIDSGPVLLRRRFPPPPDRLAIDHVFDSAARAKVLVETLQKYQQSGTWHFEMADNAGGEVFYIIHPLLKHLAILAK